MGLIINRYTSRPQEKSVFAILLEWPDNGSVILNEPVVTQGQTQVRLHASVILPIYTQVSAYDKRLSDKKFLFRNAKDVFEVIQKSCPPICLFI